MKRTYYYLANIEEGFGENAFWDHVVKEENAEHAKKLYADLYFAKFGNYPIAVSVKRTDKATFEDVNMRDF